VSLPGLLSYLVLRPTWLLGKVKHDEEVVRMGGHEVDFDMGKEVKANETILSIPDSLYDFMCRNSHLCSESILSFRADNFVVVPS
jgi:hypothetical protein